MSTANIKHANMGEVVTDGEEEKRERRREGEREGEGDMEIWRRERGRER